MLVCRGNKVQAKKKIKSYINACIQYHLKRFIVQLFFFIRSFLVFFCSLSSTYRVCVRMYVRTNNVLLTLDAYMPQLGITDDDHNVDDGGNGDVIAVIVVIFAVAVQYDLWKMLHLLNNLIKISDKKDTFKRNFTYFYCVVCVCVCVL